MNQKAEPAMSPQKKCLTAFLLIADVKGLNELDGDFLLSCFFEHFHPALFSMISTHNPLVATSIADTVCCVFTDPTSATNCALDMRDFCKEFNFQESDLPQLSIRISLHSSKIYTGDAPAADAIRAQINLASRIEPILRPGEVWTCDTFVTFLPKTEHDFTTDNLGVKPSAKKWGGQELHRVRRKSDLPFAEENIYEKSESIHLDPVAILFSLYERGDDEQQMNAVRMLGKKNDLRAVEKLSSIAQDGNLSLHLRLAAISSLGEQKSSQAVPTLATMLDFKEYEDPRIQISCLDAIVTIGSSNGGPVILHLLKNMDEYQAAVIRRALESLSILHHQAAIDYIVEKLYQEQFEGQLLKTVLFVLTQQRDHTATSAAIKLIDQAKQDDVRYGALIYLLHVDPNCVMRQFQEIAGDRKEPFEIRIVALAGLTKIGSNTAKSIVAEIAEAAESVSSYAAQFLIEGMERVEQFEEEVLENFIY